MLRPRLLSFLLLLGAVAAIAGFAPATARADTDPNGPEGPFGTLVCKEKGVEYAFTQNDVIWTARMLVGEAGGQDNADSAAVLFCMINSYALRPVRTTYPTFTDFIRAYCTPLQPYLKNQSAIDRHVKWKTPMVEVEPGKWQLKRHVDIQMKPWARLPESARELAVRALSGAMENLSGNATQFCSTRIYYRQKHDRNPTAEQHKAYTEAYAARKKLIWIVPEGTDVNRNVFFEEERFAKLPRTAARVVVPQGTRRKGCR